MSHSKIFSVLHVSDFHYSKKKSREQAIVVDALIEDLEGLCIGHRQPDIVLFTGDLVNAAATDNHLEAYDFFLKRVSTATKCSDERIFVVPGNHDASRRTVEDMLDQHLAWRGQADAMDAVNQLFEDGTFGSLGDEKFQSFQELAGFLSGGVPIFRNIFVTIYRIDILNVEMVILNTALLTGTGADGVEKDLRCMAVAEYAVLDALKALTATSFRIFATHHPLDWLSETSAKFLRGVIQREGAMHMFGHMHEPLSAHTTSYEGELFSNQAGATFSDRRRYNGYALVSVEPAERLFEAHLRSFYKDRRQFDAAIDVTSEGKFYSSQKARQFWRGIGAPIKDQDLRRYLREDCLPPLLGDPEWAGIGDKGLHEMFVPAPMQRNHLQPQKLNEPEMTLEVTVAFDDLVRGEGHCIVYADPEFGRTTVLRELQYRLLSDSGELTFARVPVILDFAEIRQNADSLLKTVRSRIVSSNEVFDFGSLINLGHVCLMIDDVVFEDAKRMAILRDFVTRYPKVRYVFTSLRTSVAPYGASLNPEMPIQFDFVELCAFRRRDMRMLVTKWDTCADVDRVLERIQAEISEINLPFTAANGSILMVIFEQQSGFRPINRWVLIEQFVEVTLTKASVEQSKRETFDYHNKTALLAHVAGWMVANDTYVVDREIIRGVMRAYIQNIEIAVDLDWLMAEFLGSRLFVIKPGDKVSFRYRAVLEYFIAFNMKRDLGFRTWVLDDVRYLSFLNEIQYFAGAVRDDTKLVDEVGRRFVSILEELTRAAGGIDLDRLTSLELPSVGDEQGAIDSLARHLSAAPLTQAEQDAELEGEIPRDVEHRQEVFRPRIEHIGHKFLTCLLLYSGLIKNMEEISGSDKRRHLASVWRGWGAFLHLSLQLVPDLARERKVRINGVLYELTVPRSMSDAELARGISLGMPLGIGRLVAASLGTEKLEQQLVEPDLFDVPEPLIVEFFRTALIADLRLPSAPAALRNSLKKLGVSRYLSEAMIQKIIELRRVDRLWSEDFGEIRASVAQARAVLSGASGRAIIDEKRKHMARLQRQDVILRLRTQHDGD